MAKKLFEILSSNKEFAQEMFLGGDRSLSRGGYVVVKYKKYIYLEHRLVFYANGVIIPEGMEIHHIDSDKTNNRLENLLILTHDEHVKLHVEKETELLEVSKLLCFIGDK